MRKAPTAPAEPRNPVREVRTALELTQQQMADKIGCGYSTIRYWEANALTPNAKAIRNNLKRLAKQAGIELPEDGGK